MSVEIPKKIAIITFPVLDIGGIISWADEMQVALRELGATVDHYYSTAGNRYECSATERTFIGDKYKRGEKLPGGFLSYGDGIEESVGVLAEYALIIFSHPSPHPTRSNLSHGNNSLGWTKLYNHPKLTNVAKVVGIHDCLWKKTNPWFILVADHIDLLIADQRPHFKSFEGIQFPSCTAKKGWIYYPFQTDGIELSHSREGFGMVAHQWLKWKNHHKIIHALDGNCAVPINFFAGGQEYHNLLADKTLEKFLHRNEIEDVTYQNKQPAHHFYYGFISRPELMRVYSRALFSIDGSVRGYNNFTHFEPMLFGCISMVHEEVLAKQDNSIPPECCVPYNWKNLAEQVKHVASHPKSLKVIRQRAFEFIKENFNNKEMVKKMLGMVGDAGDAANLTDEMKNERLVLEERAIETCGFSCWGTVDEKDSAYKEYCEPCPWLDVCRNYVEKYGKRVIETESVQQTEKPVADTVTETVAAPVEVKQPEQIIPVGSNVRIDISFANKEITIKIL